MAFKRKIEGLTRDLGIQEDAADEASDRDLILEGNRISKDIRSLRRKLNFYKAVRRALSLRFAK